VLHYKDLGLRCDLVSTMGFLLRLSTVASRIDCVEDGYSVKKQKSNLGEMITWFVHCYRASFIFDY